MTSRPIIRHDLANFLIAFVFEKTTDNKTSWFKKWARPRLFCLLTKRVTRLLKQLVAASVSVENLVRLHFTGETFRSLNFFLPIVVSASACGSSHQGLASSAPVLFFRYGSTRRMTSLLWKNNKANYYIQSANCFCHTKYFLDNRFQ